MAEKPLKRLYIHKILIEADEFSECGVVGGGEIIREKEHVIELKENDFPTREDYLRVFIEISKAARKKVTLQNDTSTTK